jgi:hypothetical protein
MKQAEAAGEDVTRAWNDALSNLDEAGHLEAMCTLFGDISNLAIECGGNVADIIAKLYEMREAAQSMGLSDLADSLRDSIARKVLIDHHLNPERASFDLVFSESEISSASELLYQVLLALPGVGTADRLPLDVLTSLMTGMTTDTNNFANSVFPSTLQMASELLAAGVDRDALIDHLYHSYRENRLRAMGACLQERMRITPDGVAFIVLDRAFMERFDLQEGETEGFVNLPLGIGRVRLSLLLREDDGHFRVGLRLIASISNYYTNIVKDSDGGLVTVTLTPLLQFYDRSKLKYGEPR